MLGSILGRSERCYYFATSVWLSALLKKLPKANAIALKYHWPYVPSEQNHLCLGVPVAPMLHITYRLYTLSPIVDATAPSILVLFFFSFLLHLTAEQKSCTLHMHSLHFLLLSHNSQERGKNVAKHLRAAAAL